MAVAKALPEKPPALAGGHSLPCLRNQSLARTHGTSFPVRCQTEPVVGGVGEILPGAEVAFGGLDGGMAEQELDLFQVTAGGTAQLGTGAARIVGLELHTQFGSV